MVQPGTLAVGHKIRNDRRPRIIFGEEIDISGDTEYVLIVDLQKGSEVFVKDLVAGFQRLAEFITDGVLYGREGGKLVMKKLLEYNARRYKTKYQIQKNAASEKGFIPKGPESKTVVISAGGKSCADGMKDVQEKVGVEEFGNVLSMQKGKRDEAIIRIQADGRKAEEVSRTLQGKLKDVKIEKLGKSQRKAHILIKDLNLILKKVLFRVR